MGNNVTVDKFNIRKAIEETVHFPRTKGDISYPMYRHVDNYNGNGDASYNNLYNAPGARNDMMNKYNSPNNVQRLIVFKNGIIVTTFAGPIIQAPDKRGRRGNKRYIGDTVVNGQLASMLTGNNTTYLGNPLKAILEPNLCSNIEEIYIDSSCLCTDYVLSGPFAERILSMYENGLRVNGVVESMTCSIDYLSVGNKVAINRDNFPMEFLAWSLNMDVAGVEKKFSRLHSVGIMEHMGVRDSEAAINDILNIKGKPTVFGIKELAENGSTILAGNTNMFMYFNADVFKANSTKPLTTREGIYEYDRVVLAGVNAGIARGIIAGTEESNNNSKEVNNTTDKESNAQGINEDEQSESQGKQNNSKSEIESELDKIYANNRSMANMQEILFIACRGKTKDEVEQMFNEMSPSGKTKYKALLVK